RFRLGRRVATGWSQLRVTSRPLAGLETRAERVECAGQINQRSPDRQRIELAFRVHARNRRASGRLASALLFQRTDVPDQRPTVVFREVLPGRHGAPPVRDLPEQLPVGLALHVTGRPVGGLGRECRGGDTVPLPPGPLAW